LIEPIYTPSMFQRFDEATLFPQTVYTYLG
jgi:hypothetical protein